MKLCPKCKKFTMRDRDIENSLSRKDNETYICNPCGTREAFNDMDADAKAKIIDWMMEENLIDTPDFD